MSVLNENQLLGASGAGGEFEIEQSLRFDDGRDTYLSRTFPSAGNRKTWTYSLWFKRGNLGGGEVNIFKCYTASNNNSTFQLRFNGSDQLLLGAQTVSYGTPTQVFRDTSSWYHLVIAVDTTQGTANNRVKVYVNGQQVTSFSSKSNPSQNADLGINQAAEHVIGSSRTYSNMFDGYMGEVNFIDGQALTPDSFGETGDYSEWKPTKYSGTYGTNGFYLPFEQDYTVEGFSTVTYEGKGVAQYIGGTGFSPSLVWTKARNQTYDHHLFDVIRGPLKRISSNSTSAESSMTNSLTAFNTDGFTLGDTAQVNLNGGEFVAWNWDMGNTTASNTSGSITSSVRANTAYGQSIVKATYSGSGTQTFGHGLGVAPDLILGKALNHAYGWGVYHSGLSSAQTKSLALNTTAAESTNNMWGNTQPTSSVFSANIGSLEDAGHPVIFYCFSSVTNYSSFGSYSGNGSTTGPVVTLGFSPAFVMIKRTDAANNWMMYDNTRSPSNPNSPFVMADSSNAENTSSANQLDFNANDFQITGTGNAINASGGTYIYAAFADTREYAYWYDQSGNNNDWTSEGGLTESDVMLDSPTNNFSTMNPLVTGGGVLTLSEGNLAVSGFGSARQRHSTMMPSSGKWYAEFLCTAAPNDVQIGIANDLGTGYLGNTANSWGIVSANGNRINAEIQSSYGTGYSTGDIIGVALDLDNGKVFIAENNTYNASGNPVTGSNPMYSSLSGAIGFAIGSNSTLGNVIANFGSDSSFAGNKTPQANQDSNGIGNFFYPVPSGFLALCTANLPSVDVIPSEHFNTLIYSGTDSDNRAITGVGFRPDFAWFKRRSSATNHGLFDSIRGANKRLSSNLTDAEFSDSNALMSFDSDGYTVSSDGTTNAAGTYVAWNWKAGGATPSKTYTVTVVSDSGNKYRFDGFGTSAATLNLQEGGTYTFNYPAAHPFRFSTTSDGTHGGGSEYTTGVTHVSSTQTKIVVAASAPQLYYYCSVHSGMGGAVNTNATSGSSNFNGSIISTVSANVDAGFSIVSYTGNLTAGATVGHGLSKTPEMFIVKSRSAVFHWPVYHHNNTSAPETDYLELDTSAATSDQIKFWNDTLPTSTVFSLGDSSTPNQNNGTYIAYCFHSVESYSKVGSYTGNGSATDGTFVHCGFAVSFLLIKDTGAGNTWVLLDSKRDSINPNDTLIQPQLSAAETTGWAGQVDFLSNGFKIRSNDNALNAARTYIFYAIAENPFKHTNAR